MRKIKYLFALVLLAITMTGCVKYKATMTINKNKSMDFSIIYAFDKSLLGESSELKEEDFKEAKEQGFSVEKYKEDNYEGFTLSKSIKNIDEVSTTEDVAYDISGMMSAKDTGTYMFKVAKEEKKNTYTAKFTFDSNNSSLSNDSTNDDEDLPDEDDSLTVDSSLDSGNNSLDNMDLSGLTSSMDLSFTVNLPNAAISSNATTKENDGKTLVWKLNASGKQTLEFTFELDNDFKEDSNLLLYIGIGAGALLLVAIIVIVIVSKNKKSPAPVVEPSEPIKKEEK